MQAFWSVYLTKIFLVVPTSLAKITIGADGGDPGYSLALIHHILRLPPRKTRRGGNCSSERVGSV